MLHSLKILELTQRNDIQDAGGSLNFAQGQRTLFHIQQHQTNTDEYTVTSHLQQLACTYRTSFQHLSYS